MAENGVLSKDRRLAWKPFRYSVDIGNTGEAVELPFVLVVIADLTKGEGSGLERLRDRKLLHLEHDSLDHLIASQKTCVHINVPNRLTDESEYLNAYIEFHSIDDFRPDRVAQKINSVRLVSELRSELREIIIRLEMQPELEYEIEKTILECSSDPWQGDFITAILNEKEGSDDEGYVLISITCIEDLPEIVWRYINYLKSNNDRGLMSALNDLIVEIDARLSSQLDEIIHYPDFQQIEATWRGLEFLTKEVETGSLLKIRVLNASKKEISKELRKYKGTAWDQSPIFKKLYEEEAYSLGGQPISLVVCDYYLNQHPDDVSMLSELSSTLGACLAPAIFGIDTSLFNLDSWEDFNQLRDASKIFDTSEYAKWRSLRASQDASFLIGVMPRLLARAPWKTDENITSRDIGYEEDTSSKLHFCWMNGVYGFASVIANSFARDRWCADLRGPVWGRIDGVPAHYVIEQDEIVDVIGPTEIDVSDRRQRELAKLGITPILRHRMGGYAAVIAPEVLRKYERSENETIDERYRMASQLEHLLCMGRVQHVVRSYLRDHSSLFENKAQLTIALEQWLKEYSCESIEAEVDEPELYKRFPFRKVRIRSEGEVIRRQEPGIEIELEMNYVPTGVTISKVLLVATPPGVISSRLIP